MGRASHEHRDLARYLYVERGITSLDDLGRMTGIAVKTLERYRAADGWMEMQRGRQDGEASALESLDDVADSIMRMLLRKTAEYEHLPVELLDPDLMRGLHKLVQTIQLLTGELRRMSKRDKLLTMHDFMDFSLAAAQASALGDETLTQVLELVGGYCDHVLAAEK